MTPAVDQPMHATDVVEPSVRHCRDAVVMPVVNYGNDQSLTKGGPYFQFIGGVYAAGKEAVPEALHLWLTDLVDDKWEYRPRQTELQAPYAAPKEQRQGSHIFCGRAFDNFAHFIMESLARIWLARKHPEWTLVWTGADGYLSWQREILDVLGVRNPECFISVPTALEHLAVPSAGHIMPSFYAPYYLAALGVVEPRSILPGRRVFLSRSRSHGGGFVNEQALDDLLIAAGWIVLYPETLPVADRFDLLSSAETILMVEGAAFASLLLFRSLKSRVVTLARDDPGRFAHEPWFNDLFSAIADAKDLDYRRLDLPKRYVSGIDHAARFELDLCAFERLMRQTDHLSKSDPALDGYERTTVVDPTRVRVLADAAIRGVSTDTTPAVRHAYLSGLAEARGDLTEASREAGLAVAARPGSVCLLQQQARLAEQRGDLIAARTALEQAIQLEAAAPAGCYAMLAGIMLKTGHVKAAAASARRAIELEPGEARFWAILGTALAQGNAWIEARNAFEQAVALDADFVDALQLLSHVCSQAGDLQAAVARAEDAARKAPERALLHRHLGNLRFALGDPAGAAQAFTTAIKLDPDDVAARRALADARQEMTRHGKAAHPQRLHALISSARRLLRIGSNGRGGDRRGDGGR